MTKIKPDNTLPTPPHFYAPKNWPIFLVAGLLRLLSKLPYRLILSIGQILGTLVANINSKNRRILLRNLELCFPEKTDDERLSLAKSCLVSHTLAALETAMAWWSPVKRLKKLLRVTGREHLDAALKTGRGVMLIAGHFTGLELQGRMVSLLVDYSSTAKHLRYPVPDYLVNRARRGYLKTTLFPEDLKKVHHDLKAGDIIGFLLDQDYGARGSVFAPFFNIPTATTTTLARIAKSTNSIAIPTFLFRLPNAQGYELVFLPPFENYPSEDALEDATQFNRILETYVKKYPEQYGWTYKRFSTRPEGEPSRYA
jgi:KDO2-lipid IV(A) lauroyltransferase